MAAQLTRVPDPLHTFRDDVPATLAAVVRAMESRPIDPRAPMRGVGDIVTAALTAMNDIDWRAGPADSLGPKRP